MHLTCDARDGVYIINTTGNSKKKKKKIMSD
jgi:hypothetical protein